VLGVCWLTRHWGAVSRSWDGERRGWNQRRLLLLVAVDDSNSDLSFEVFVVYT
jgi:hypothetical protein